jgi:hypothetical protein
MVGRKLMLGRRRRLPVPDSLPATCPTCGKQLYWTPIGHVDTVIKLEKVDYYEARCACGEVLCRDGRNQPVEPPEENLAPDRSPVARSPQGMQPYPGTPEYAKAEAVAKEVARKAAEAAAQKAAAAKAAVAAAPPPGAPPQPAPQEQGSALPPAEPVAEKPPAEPVAEKPPAP